jgi:hypothetical protein
MYYPKTNAYIVVQRRDTAIQIHGQNNKTVKNDECYKHSNSRYRVKHPGIWD